jgi:hypothetical protein
MRHKTSRFFYPSPSSSAGSIRPRVRLGHGDIDPKLSRWNFNNHARISLVPRGYFVAFMLCVLFVYIADGLKHMTSAGITADGWQPYARFTSNGQSADCPRTVRGPVRARFTSDGPNVGEPLPSSNHLPAR